MSWNYDPIWGDLYIRISANKNAETLHNPFVFGDTPRLSQNFHSWKIHRKPFYTLWWFNIAMEAMAHENRWFTVYLLIAWWIFPWQTVSHNQRA